MTLFEKYLDSREVVHARLAGTSSSTPWHVCGLFVEPEDVPLPDDAEVTCRECLVNLPGRRRFETVEV